MNVIKLFCKKCNNKLYIKIDPPRIMPNCLYCESPTYNDNFAHYYNIKDEQNFLDINEDYIDI